MSRPAKNPQAEAALDDLMRKVNDPAVFRQAAAEDAAVFEPVNRRHDLLTRRSAATLRNDWRMRR